MSDRLQRMLEKAKAMRERKRASETILIACDRPEDAPRRVDVLIRPARSPRPNGRGAFSGPMTGTERTTNGC